MKDWSPFRLCEPEKRPPRTRAMRTVPGVGDRLRVAAFAEIQAREAFLWAATTFSEASNSLKAAWKGLAQAEDRHLNWLLRRMAEIGTPVEERPVSHELWQSFQSTSSAKDFAVFMASAEERGRIAGERFAHELEEFDPISAKIFGKIAEEEVEHIRLAEKYFGFNGPYSQNLPRPGQSHLKKSLESRPEAPRE